jgi:O-antigen ligase
MRQQKLNRERIAGSFLALVFIALFVPYVIGITLERQLIVVGILLLFGIVFLPLLFHKQAGRVLRSLLNPKFALMALILPATSTVIAVSFGKWNAVGYVLLMFWVLVACQIALAFIPLRGVLRAFSQAGIVATLLFFLSDFSGIVHSALFAIRLVPPEMQPNVLGFMFAGFIPVFAWRVADRTVGYLVRGTYIAVILADALVIFLASSRASMFALAGAIVWLGGMWGLRAFRGKVRLVKSIVLSIVLLVFAVGITIAVRPSIAEQGISYTMKTLQLESNYRGFGSGFSGRLPRWNATLAVISHNGVWAFGSGYRTSTEEMEFSVDNGYLTVAYEIGVFGLLVIVGQLVWCLGLSTRCYIRSTDLTERRYFMLLGALLTVFLVNNFFDRYLFGMGNTFSLLALFFLLLRGRNFRSFERTVYDKLSGRYGNYHLPFLVGHVRNLRASVEDTVSKSPVQQEGN